MKKLSIILIMALIVGLFPPSWLTNYVHADTLPPLEAEADLMYEDINGSSQSISSDSLGSGTFYTGREVYLGDTYISRSAFRFNLGAIPGTPTKYELKFHILQKNPIDPFFYLDIWGSVNNDMSDSGTLLTFPTWDTTAPTVRKTNNEIPNYGDIIFDVTDIVEHFTDATDRNVTFVMKGNESVFSNIILNTREEQNVAFRPQLIVTYSPNFTPTGSISINNGASYTNSTNVNLNLTGADQDGDPIEMRFSNDNTTWSGWETYTSTKAWPLSNGDGVKTVYYQLRDNSNAVSTTYSDTIILDTLSPTISGVVHNGIYNNTRTITFNEGTGSFNGIPFPSVSIIVSANGTHTLVVTDAAGNSTSVTFTIDTIAPAVTGVAHGASYNSDRTITFNEGTATLNMASFTSGTTITHEGAYTLVVTDAASNVTTVFFTIDKTSPIITGVDKGVTYNTNKTITFNEGTGLLNGTPFLSGSTVSTDGTYTLVVTDAAGNSSSVNFTIDKTAPIVTGVTNGTIYNTDLTVSFNKGSATLNGAPFTSGTTITAEDDYTLIVTDANTNVTTVAFTIDKTAPVVIGVTNGTSYNTDRIVTFNEGTATLNGTPFSSGTMITAENIYSLVVTDSALNVTTVAFTIDKTNPVVTGVDKGVTYNTTKTITFNEGTGLLNGNPFLSGTTVSTDGTYTLVVTDAAGNSTSVNFTIDKTAPIVTGVTNGTIHNTDLTVSFNKGSATLNGAPFTSGTTITAEDDYTLIVTDANTNVTTVVFTIDKTKPVIKGVTDGISYNTNQTITFNEGTGMLNGSPFTSGSMVSSDGMHTLIVTDAASNSTTVSFTIDKTAPVVTGVTDGTSYNTDLKVSFNKGSATLNGAPFTSGTTITAEDDYTLIVTDANINVITVAFTIDKTTPIVTGVSDGELYKVNKTIDFNEGTATLNGSAFTTGTTISTSGIYKLIVTDAAGNSAKLSFTIELPSQSSGTGSGGNTGGSGSKEDKSTANHSSEQGDHSADKIEIIINGVVRDQMASVNNQSSEGNKVTTIILDEDKLTQVINALPNRPTIIINVYNGSTVTIAELNSRTIQTLDKKNVSMQVQTDNASYTISTNQLNMNEVMKSFGTNIPLQDIKIRIGISNASNDEVDSIRKRVGKITIVAPIVKFTITASYDGKTVEINQFDSFVQSEIAILDGVDPKKMTTGVVVPDEGEVSYKPSRIIQKEGRYYAVIYSLSNSAYTVIYNEKSFTDITNHWAKTSIEDMAARLILKGVTEQKFQPNKEITRVEFTGIIERALGLYTIVQHIEFQDVQKKDWFYDVASIAVNNGLVEDSEDNTFKPNQKLTREEAMVMIYNAMKLAGMDLTISEEEVNEKLSVFKDSNQFQSTSRTAAALNIKFGIINGSNGTVSPGKVITRAETATIIQRFLIKAKLI